MAMGVQAAVAAEAPTDRQAVVQVVAMLVQVHALVQMLLQVVPDVRVVQAVIQNSMPTIEPQKKTYLHRIPLWIGLLVLLVIGGGFVYFQWYTNRSAHGVVQDSRTSVMEGNLITASNKAQEALE